MNLSFCYRLGTLAMACAALTACNRAPQEAAALPQAAPTTAQTPKGAEVGKLPSSNDILQEVLQASKEKGPPELLTSRNLTAQERVSMAGDDVNGNGVRDDIDTVLQKASRITPTQKLALAQSFKATQAALLVNLDDDDALNKARSELLNGWQCVAQNFGFGPTSPGILQFLETIEKQANNTPERQNRYDNLGCDSVKVLLIDPAKMAELNPKPCSF